MTAMIDRIHAVCNSIREIFSADKGNQVPAYIIVIENGMDTRPVMTSIASKFPDSQPYEIYTVDVWTEIVKNKWGKQLPRHMFVPKEASASVPRELIGTAFIMIY